MTAGVSVVVAVVLGTWNYSVPKRSLNNNVVLTYFDTTNRTELTADG